VPWQQWRDWDAVVAAMENLPLVFEPGTASAYHHLTQQWVCAELVHRLDGRAFPVYLREEVTGPLGMDDTHVGLPVALARRVAKVHATEGVDDLTIRTLNRLEVQQAPAPVFGVATARDMARFYAALAAGGSLDGVRILRPDTLAWALAPEVDGEWDRTLGGPVRRGFGFNLSGRYAPDARVCGSESTARTFYHEGAGTVLCWADPDLELAVAYMVNGLRSGKAVIRTDADGQPVVDVAPDDIGIQRNRRVSDAVRAACRPRCTLAVAT
jgi:CubicO group peptidase (beta-lactamase class C family)